MADPLDIDRTLPGDGSQGEQASESPADEPVASSSAFETPRTLRRVRTRVNLPTGEEETQTEASTSYEETPDEPPKPRRERRPIGPLLGNLNNEQLSLLAGISLTLLFVFIYFAIYEAEKDPNPLLYYTIASSLITAVAIWFYMRADNLVREQANFISGILVVLSVVFIYLGVERFSSTAWKIIVSVILAGLSTVSFFAGQVLKQR